MTETYCNIRKHYGLPKSTHGNSCPSLCAEPKVIYGLFYSWLYIPLCAACVWAVRSYFEQNCLGPFCFVSALWIIMKILNHSIHISFWTKRQTMYFGDHIFAFCNGWFFTQCGWPFIYVPWQVQFNCIQCEFYWIIYSSVYNILVKIWQFFILQILFGRDNSYRSYNSLAI